MRKLRHLTRFRYMPRRSVPIGQSRLPAFDRQSGDLNAVVEAVRGSRNKFTFDRGYGHFTLTGVLTAGASFPFDFGFIPSTTGEDGDPLDVLVLMDEPAFVGAVVPSRLIGAIEAEQTEESGETVRNDRLIAVACKSHQYGDAKSLDDLPSNLVREIEHFFISYNEVKGVTFTPIGRAGPRRAANLVRAAKG
ncbi:MAG: inorganic diphosphatase [Gemmatimonadetes bacterium]|nr:inorganic diphosphatase [Gemmatimonadota bacterium]